jgi:putative IMPACT (imprinted ancient) family translation regulator
MRRPKESVSFKYRESGSLFLAELHPALDAQARADAIAAARKRDHDATHCCTAWRMGIPSPAFGFDDDGEPSGTAGAPMLKVLEGHGITDVLAICLRWFGGTKLGTGGLARAYAESITGAILEGERLGLFERARMMSYGSIEVTHDLAHLPFGLIEAFEGAELIARDFGAASAKMTFRVPTEYKPAFDSAWRDQSRGGRVVWEE